VFSRGNPESPLWLIGEAPGADEDERGEPFLGRAGQLLDKILEAAKIGRDEVFITNTVLCRPPGNRVPTNDEIAACSVHRNALLDLWKPPLVVLLGATAARVFLGAGTKISELRGRRIEQDGRAYYPTFHPSYLLRDPSKKSLAWQDWQHIRDDFRGLATPATTPNDTASQEADDTAVLMPYLEQFVMTPDGPGRLVQVFLRESAVVLDRAPQTVTRFPTATLVRLLAQRQVG
ncbi:phage SPO1 DNA polymerase-related protein, partial [mine drainage metagenome]